MNRFKGAVRKTFFAGLVVLVPIVITALALYWLFLALDDFVRPLLSHLLGKDIIGLGIVTEIVLIFLVGLLTTNVFGSRILRFFQNLLMHLPVVKSLYSTIKHLVEAFSPNSQTSFKRVVLVEFPQKGIFSLGFLTSEVTMHRSEGETQLFSVYLPTNNLYLGQVALFKAEEVIFTGFPIEEGLKIILSGGSTFPPSIQGRYHQSLR